MPSKLPTSSGSKTEGFGGRGWSFLVSIFLIMATLVLTVPGCGPEEEETLPEETEEMEEQKEEEKEAEEEKEKEEVEVDLPEEIESLPPNETGEIMILMYHEIGEPEEEWVRTPENFRQDLEILYEEGYRPVSMNDVIDGKIDIPRGTTPVVITFDDGTEGQFRYIEEDGELVIDPDSAVGIMEEFHEEHPDFGLEATFYIFYDNPFRQEEYVEKKLNYLVDRGFEIGNHAYSHANLGQLSPEEVEKELGKFVQRTREYVPGYEIRSLALPFGIKPDPEELAVSGSYEGTEYHHEAVLEVGYYPAPSPFHEDYNTFLPRVRASDLQEYVDGVGIYDWIDRFKENPENRYLSDGNPNTLTVPEEREDEVKDDLPDHIEEVITKP